MSIDVFGFSSKFRKFSNFWCAPVAWGDSITPYQLWESNELPYQISKTLDPQQREAGIRVFWSKGYGSPGALRRWGRDPDLCTLRAGWKDPLDPIALRVMGALVLDKFRRNDDCRELLFSTGDGYLEETNHWKDTYFGVCDGVGHNFLGKLIMHTRHKLSDGALKGIVKCPNKLC